MKTINGQNRKAQKHPCGSRVPVVTVGVLTTMTSEGAGSRGLHELEGIATAQAYANTNCVRLIRLKVAQIGAKEQAAAATAKLLGADPDVVAVVGMGLSDERSAQAIRQLASQKTPMVADLITAEGFDQNGSLDDGPNFRDCAPENSYKDGVGKDFFYRMSFRNEKQIEQLSKYLKGSGYTDVIVTPATTMDPYTCTALPLIHRMFGQEVHEVKFDPTVPVTLNQSVDQQICAPYSPVRVVYAARARDLGRFLEEINDKYQHMACHPPSIIVASLSDAGRMRAEEWEPALEETRRNDLIAGAFVTGTVRLIYTPLADPDILRKQVARERVAGFADLERMFTAVGFDVSHLDDGWAINGYDALITVFKAVKDVTSSVDRANVNEAIGGYASADQSVDIAAGGRIAFDNNGNRKDFDTNGKLDDSKPVVVELCPAASGSSRPRTVEASAGGCR
jgi:ABC-type branched-subunit amino acid transport system substrate-binding protein